MFELKTVKKELENFDLVLNFDGAQGVNSSPDNFLLPPVKDLLKDKKIINAIEIGSYLGLSAIKLASLLPKTTKLFCVDPWQYRGTTASHISDIYHQFLSNIHHAKFDEQIIPFRMYSNEAVKHLNMLFDLIYIDGDHSEEGVTRDLQNYFPKLAPNGLITGDDWCLPWGGDKVDCDFTDVSVHHWTGQLTEEDQKYSVRCAVKKFFPDKTIFSVQNFWWVGEKKQINLQNLANLKTGYQLRPQIFLSENSSPVFIPYLEQITLVTGGNSVVFDQMFECLLSIKNTKFYGNLHVEIIDCGLTYDQKKKLYEEFQVVCFHDAIDLFNFYIGRNVLDCNKKHDFSGMIVCTLQFFLSKIIKTKYYIWIEADVWLQSEELLNEFVRHLIQFDVACCEHSSLQPTKFLIDIYSDGLGQKFDHLSSKKLLAAGLYGVLTEHSCLRGMQDTLIDILKNYEYQLFYEEFAFLSGLYSSGFNENLVLPRYYHFAGTKWFEDPYLDESDFLIDPFYKKPIGFFHYAGDIKETIYNYPLIRKNRDSSDWEEVCSLRYCKT